MADFSNYSKYISSLKEKLALSETLPTNVDEIKNTFLQHKQALYIINYKKNKITYQRNIEELLGYKKNEFTVKLVLEDFLHPKQKTIASIVISSIISFATDGMYDKEKSRFVMIYKVRHKNGEYRTILRQTNALEIDSKNRMISNYSIITDVTDILVTDKVEWRLEGGKPGFEDIVNKKIRSNTKEMFSQTELKLLEELKKGRKSKDIACKWNKSLYTINTHRRNMLKKANCGNTPELLFFAAQLDLELNS